MPNIDGMEPRPSWWKTVADNRSANEDVDAAIRNTFATRMRPAPGMLLPPDHRDAADDADFVDRILRVLADPMNQPIWPRGLARVIACAASPNHADHCRRLLKAQSVDLYNRVSVMPLRDHRANDYRGTRFREQQVVIHRTALPDLVR